MSSLITADALRQLAAAAPSAAQPGCSCRALQVPAWESVTDARWPASVVRIGSLRVDLEAEPTYEEYHPEGTRYDSPDAPIAVQYFPFNRADVYRCSDCARVFLRYTEYGGYYVDHRVRQVDAALVL